MSLRKRSEENALLTTQATKRIGLVAQVIVDSGIAPHGRGITAVIKNECFRAYGDESEAETRSIVEKSTQVAIKYLQVRNFSVGPVLRVTIVPDTSLTPTSRWTGGMYSMKPFEANDRFTHKRHSDFIFDFMSPEIDDLGGKAFWAHIAWKNLPNTNPAEGGYGGDYSLINAENSDELSIIITYLKNKREATELVKNLREGVTTVDALCVARGYDVEGIRKDIGEALRNSAGGKDDSQTATVATISELGEKTKQFHMTVKGFTEAKTIKFIEENYDTADGDIWAMTDKVGAEAGDIAILLNKPEFFEAQMKATGLKDAEAVVKVAKDTGLANAADLAKFLGIDEAAF